MKIRLLKWIISGEISSWKSKSSGKKNESLLLLLEKYNVDKVTKSADVFFVSFCILCS